MCNVLHRNIHAIKTHFVVHCVSSVSLKGKKKRLYTNIIAILTDIAWDLGCFAHRLLISDNKIPIESSYLHIK